MPHGLNFLLNSELIDFFFTYASSLLILLSWSLEQKFSDNGAFANYVFQYIGNVGFIFILFSLVEFWSLMPEIYFLLESIFSTG